MTKAEVRSKAMQLSERERLQLAEELSTSVPDPNDYPVDIPLPKWQADLLDQRMQDLERNPEEGSSWEEVEERVWPTT